MNSQQVQDIHLMYEAVYNDELREKADEYNSMIRDEDVVEVATEYFYTYGLNSTGVDILIEKVGLDNFVEFVYDLSEDILFLGEAKKSKSKKQPSMLANQRAKLAAQKRKEEEKEPESKGADTEAKAEQPKSKKPIRDAIARQILAGMKRHREATQTAGNLARETGKTLGKLASVTHEAGRRAGEHVKKHGLKSLANEEFEYWVNTLVEEGYDLSKYTWDDMYDYYISESAKRKPKKIRGEKNPEKYMAGRSDAGKRISGDEDTGPRYYTLGRSRGARADAPTQPGQRPVGTPRLASWEKDDIQYRKANLKAGKVHKVGGEKGLPEEYDNFDYILEYLISEGYADTNENALAIMANMSEEWKQSIFEAPGEWFGGLRDKARASRDAQMQALNPTPKPGPTVSSPFAKPASTNDSGRLTTYGAGGGAAAERRGKTRSQVMQQGAKNLENKNRNPGPNFGR